MSIEQDNDFKKEVRLMILNNNFSRFTNRTVEGDRVSVIIKTLDDKSILCTYKETDGGNDLKIISAEYAENIQ